MGKEFSSETTYTKGTPFHNSPISLCCLHSDPGKRSTCSLEGGRKLQLFAMEQESMRSTQCSYLPSPAQGNPQWKREARIHQPEPGTAWGRCACVCVWGGGGGGVIVSPILPAKQWDGGKCEGVFATGRNLSSACPYLGFQLSPPLQGHPDSTHVQLQFFGT